MQDVILLTGAGQIGLAIARRMGHGKKIVVSDKNINNAQTVTKIMAEAGFDAVAVEADISSRKSILNMIAAAQKYGEIAMLINAAGVSPSQASVETILKSGSIRYSSFVGRSRKSDQSWWYWCYDIQPVWAQNGCLRCGNRRTACCYTGRRTAAAGSIKAGQYQRHTACVSNG